MNKPPQTEPTVQITSDGPYLVSGNLPLSVETIGTNREGESIQWKSEKKFLTRATYALCRCGQSATKPFCDGTHAKVNFDGTETASREKYVDQAKVMHGPTMSLTDAEGLCASPACAIPRDRCQALLGPIWLRGGAHATIRFNGKA